MKKEGVLSIRLDPKERAKLDRLAKHANLPVSVAARKLLIELADQVEPAEGETATDRR